MNRILFSFFAGLLAACSAGPASQWIAEDESGDAVITFKNDTLEIAAPKGLTLWYSHPLKGDYCISWTATVVMEGGHYDRLADLNCFWAARDPEHPGDFFARKEWRNGIFRRYNSLDLFYVGYGGNSNTTTRFRRYHGQHYGSPDAVVKPLLRQYTDVAHLLAPNRPYRIQITVSAGRTTFSVNGEPLFSHELAPGEGDGYFGLRLLANHTLISGFKIEYL